MIPLYDEDDNCIGRVKCHREIGEVCTGRFLGYTKLKDGRYVLIRTTQWQGEHDFAEVVRGDDLVDECLRHNCYDELIEKYPELKKVEIVEED